METVEGNEVNPNTMKINVYNSPEGQLKWCKEEVPEEPKYCTDFGDIVIICNSTFCKCSSQLKYRIADLERIKKESVPFEDQEKIVSLIAHGQTILDVEKAKAHYCKPDTFYSFQWEGQVIAMLQTRHGVEWHDLPGQNVGRDREGIYQTVARLIPAKQDHPEVKTPTLDEVFKDIPKGKLDSHYKGEVKKESQEDDIDAWHELGNQINKLSEPLDDAFGVHPLLDIIRQRKTFTITRK